MFKPIKNYEVSESGRVRSVNRIVEFKNGRIRKFNGKELKLQMNNQGYSFVFLSKNGIHKVMTVHRLVANAFLPNPNNLPEVHHKNHDIKDNRAENLQWTSRSEQFDEHDQKCKVPNCV